MNYRETRELLHIVGSEETLVAIIERFPNRKLPGKKIRYRLKKDKFVSEYHGTNIRGYAEKYGVSITTLYNWLK